MSNKKFRVKNMNSVENSESKEHYFKIRTANLEVLEIFKHFTEQSDS